MTNPRDILHQFYKAVVARDFMATRRSLHEDLVFVGLYDWCRRADSYLRTLADLMGITKRLDVRAVIAARPKVAVFFELETGPPAGAMPLVGEWHQLQNGKIEYAESAFDGLPFATMFGGGDRR